MHYIKTIQEIVDAYNREILSPELLAELMTNHEGELFEQSDIEDIRADDGLAFEQIVVKVMEPKEYEEIGACPINLSDPKKRPPEDSELWDEFDDWVCAIGEIFDYIMLLEWCIEIV